MRRALLTFGLLLLSTRVEAQGPLTDHLQILGPGLTASVFVDLGGDQTACDLTVTGSAILYTPRAFGSAFVCEAMRQGFLALGSGTDATGAFYQITPNPVAGSTDVVRSAPGGVEPLIRLLSANGLILNLAVDNTLGRLLLAVRILEPPATQEHVGIVAVSGLPQMFDTLLTFIPGGQLSALVPAHPDGFRSGDSIQVWTGNVRSMPDWSQAQPLTCNAATNPIPGQIVTVGDTLPDPSVGSGRYYLTATQHAADRRLGRQYVNGAFAARDPLSLPACVTP